jgi:hypothetical protein
MGGFILAYEEQIHGNNIETKALIMQFFIDAKKPVRYKKNYLEAKPICLVKNVK